MELIGEARPAVGNVQCENGCRVGPGLRAQINARSHILPTFPLGIMIEDILDKVQTAFGLYRVNYVDPIDK